MRDLGPREVVVTPHLNGNLHLTNCARATVLLPCSYEGSITVDGKDPRRDGILGIETRLATLTTHALYLRNNQSVVASDFYIEQANNGFVFEGDPDDPPGRATLQGPKLHFTVPKEDPAQGTAVTIRNYAGRIFLGPEQYYVEPLEERITQAGEREVELYLLASIFYKTRPVPTGPGLKLRLLGNECFGPQPEESKFTAADDAPAGSLAAVSEMLDDLRRLGEVDL
ncbi:MAG: hypothetical protein HYU66_23335, partial [Armatimonadetes bacterium]|nr:hypothetical protein [Armatimonadota bacterium]